MKKVRKEKIDFDTYYQNLFPERWHNLKESFKREKNYVAYRKGLLQPYFLDKASVIAAEALDVQPAHTVLDMCAAPGGKTLVIASRLGSEGKLIANDRSSKRRERLIRVIDGYLPEQTKMKIEVTGYDATRWGLYEQDRYDRILVDVPCSSERHIEISPPHRARWSPARTKHLAVQATAMLLAAITALKPGGKLIYSTCALSPWENDGVIRKALQKKGTTIAITSESSPIGESTAYGTQIWPDNTDGMGPIYFVGIKKIMLDI